MDLEDTYVDALDPEKLIQCPHDNYHQIRACRFPYHLIKCRKNHPEIAKQLATCPFNVRHQVPRAEISRHLSSCDDKRCIDQDIDLQEQSNSAFLWGTFDGGVNRGDGGRSTDVNQHLYAPGQCYMDLPLKGDRKYMLQFKFHIRNPELPNVGTQGRK